MRIRLNGAWTETDARTVGELLKSLGVEPTRPGSAVALNQTVVPRSKWAETELCEDDEIEVIHATQGG